MSRHDPHELASFCQAEVMATSWEWAFTPTPTVECDERSREALGPLHTLAIDPRVTDVFVVGDGRVFAERGEGSHLVTGLIIPPDYATELARSLIEAGGRHVDEGTPLVDVRLGPGIRVHVALPPITTEGALISLRFQRARHVGLSELSLDWSESVRRQVVAAVAAHETLLITGAAGSGKTTLLQSLMALVSPRERIVVIEDVHELTIDHPHVVTLECRQANLEGAGEVTLQRLVRESLRMRPNRLVVGECRGEEIRDLFQAFTTGHRGGAATLHANSLEEVAVRLDALGAIAGLSSHQVARQAHSAFDWIIHIDHPPGSSRSVTLGSLQLSHDGSLEVISREPS